MNVILGNATSSVRRGKLAKGARPPAGFEADLRYQLEKRPVLARFLLVNVYERRESEASGLVFQPVCASRAHPAGYRKLQLAGVAAQTGK